MAFLGFWGAISTTAWRVNFKHIARRHFYLTNVF
jgi:hypothetical protein